MKSTPLPFGFRITLDREVRQLSGGLWFGGSPARVLRLTEAGQKAWQQLEDGPVTSAAAGTLARRLTDAGMATPVPPEPEGAPDVTVVIPAHDRVDLLERCLSGMDDVHPVLVVDDASEDAAAVAAICAAYGAKLVRRDVNGGPGAARNTALEQVTTELVAFLDSDCVPTKGWIDRLAAHFADPLLAAIAPRVRGLAPDSWAGRYTRATGSLDLGDRSARVAPGTRTSYVPTAALVVRRSTLVEVGAFDPRLRVGEDVDLIWRLHKADHRIRYAADVHVDHHEPTTWHGVLGRRARYGTSAAPLALRHPDALAHLALHPWSILTVAALLARRPLLAATAFGGSVASMVDQLHANDVPQAGAVRVMATAAGQTWLGCGRYATQFAAPVLAALMVPGGRRRWGRRAALASLLLGPPLAGWVKRRPALDPVRYTVAAVADDIAYGSGVWAGCLTHRTAAPLRPAVVRRPLRFDLKGKQ
ncbi:mycofactocin biosynthesis glycosyltransferase MftF [Amycolatopsis keratiniphila]|uniref:mycofactocin biosynthesis glycosyltransferase MftF n=1 Tax=Amycolatopsis keratiniphila TaxID=129921 RepID=UPI00087C1DC1|nr:mycofactocin biosynthesis glycosyltransferase MftF [Amycolatopsis keratiniphila]OLZ42964.1 mycofactocin system glycosyltransferase [Amycolatopsis keratiniphila subsp. nogabecina]SDU66478.1 mycofactocin system glycosyltransferase [Amycolatopsis keratiniphila]